ncbi:MAG: hypothetical protein AAGH78_18640, partial [Cyanobacteria bacterium P01_H01_bin.58]
GLRQIQDPPLLVAIPAGPVALQAFLQSWEDNPLLTSGGLLLLGLGGSLIPEYGVTDSVILENVWDGLSDRNLPPHTSDRSLIDWLSQRLPEAALGTGLTCDHVVTTAVEKQQLRDRYQVDVVDMESAVFLAQNPTGKLAVLRVISDDCKHDLPNIANAIGADGSIQPLPLALKFIQRPLAAARLISGSLKGLKTLEIMTTKLFNPGSPSP